MRNLVVGVDGSPASARALDWAVTTVGPSGQVHAVAAVRPETRLTVNARPADGDRYLRLLQEEIETVWTRYVRDRVATLTATASAGCAADALVAAAHEHDADAVVVGAHVSPRLAPRAIGTTTRRLLRTLEFPLVVVPEGFVGSLDDGGPLIVGIGHGDATDAAVCWAAHLADRRELAIGLVRATGSHPIFQIDGLLDALAYYIDPAQRDEWTHEDLARFAAEVQALTDLELDVSTTVVPGRPAQRLVDASDMASLLVIGQHRSLITGDCQATRPLRHALTHARCPVVVIPAAPIDDAVDDPVDDLAAGSIADPDTAPVAATSGDPKD